MAVTSVISIDQWVASVALVVATAVVFYLLGRVRQLEHHVLKTISPLSSLLKAKDVHEQSIIGNVTPQETASGLKAPGSDAPKPLQRSSSSYRIEEELNKKTSSEFTRRGQLWSKHASWHLPSAPRHPEGSRKNRQELEHINAILQKYDVDPDRGFLPSKDPLQRLPYARYHLWEDLGDDLHKLLSARLGKAREPLSQLPILSTDKLQTTEELRRAHLLLCLFAHAYVWGGATPIDEIPEGIAVPLCEVSEKLGIPPVLGHPSIVLYNWRRLDLEAEISMENLSTLNNFFDGRDESWFYLITVEVEARGAEAIVPIMLSMDAIQRFQEEVVIKTIKKRSGSGSYSSSPKSKERGSSVDFSEGDDRYLMYDEDVTEVGSASALVGELNFSRVAPYVTRQLNIVSSAIKKMCESLTNMREGCHPFIFYHRVRPFLSGWRHNPTLPNGVIYRGVFNNSRQQFYGGSAAQSTLLPFLDIALGISHDSVKSKDFLQAMRDYMPVRHREFLVYLETVSCIRSFIMSAENENYIIYESSNKANMKYLVDLKTAYDECVESLQNFRTGHIALVAEYIISQQKKGVNKETLEGSAGGKGTGGTDLMKFLKPIRDKCSESLLSSTHKETYSVEDNYDTSTVDDNEKLYRKEEGDFDDIDLFRGASHISGKFHYQQPIVDERWARSFNST